MPSTVIVALPAEDEPVWEYSSEKKPHLTLLYLDTPLGTDIETIVQHVKHTTETTLHRFGLGVEKRGTLFRGDVHFRHTDAARFPVGQAHAGQRLLIPPVERFHGQIGTNLFHCTHLPRRFCAYYVRGLPFHAIRAQKLTCFLSLGLAMKRMTWYHIAVNCKAWR